MSLLVVRETPEFDMVGMSSWQNLVDIELHPYEMYIMIV